MKVGLCCIGRLENQYAVEFVEHYKSLGFDKIFIYDNNYRDEEYFEDVLQTYVNEGFVEITDYRNREVAQLAAYKDCYSKHGNEYDWIAFFDFDEFLELKEHKDIHEFLEGFGDFECVLINWMVMTDNGQVYNTHRQLKERFTQPMEFDKCVGYNFPENNHVKSIVKGGLNTIEFSNPHVASTPLKCANANGESVKQSPFVKYDFSKAYIKHYQYKTIEECLTNKYRRGTPDQTYEHFLSKMSLDNFFKVNGKTDFKLDVINNQRRQLVIVSMTTIPLRKKRLTDNLPFLLHQSYRYDKLIINIDDNLSEEDYKWYDELSKQDPRIEINKSEAKWRSCNKLLPTLKKYPHDVIITLDDDIAYPKDTILELIKEHRKHPECIISHEINPIVVEDNKVTYLNAYDVKLMQVEWGKYFSNCALFPPYSFDEDLFDYDKMMKCTNGTHDELWFWTQSTIHGVQCIGLNYVRSFAPEMLEEYKEDEYCLTNFNNTKDKIEGYMNKINEMYGERLISNINSKPVVFVVTKDNIYAFLFLWKYIQNLYSDKTIIKYIKLTNGWKNKLFNVVDGYERPGI